MSDPLKQEAILLCLRHGVDPYFNFAVYPQVVLEVSNTAGIGDLRAGIKKRWEFVAEDLKKKRMTKEPQRYDSRFQ